MWSVELIVIAAMIGFNSLFAAYEIALASVSLARLRLLSAENRRGAAAALFMKENMEGSLATVQLGITLVGAVAAATGGAGAAERIAPWLRGQYGFSEELDEFVAIAVVVVPLTAVTIVFGELVPKVFALRNKEWVCIRMSPAMRWFSAGVWPVVWLFEAAVVGIMKWSERWRPTVEDGRSEAAELQELRANAALARTSRLIGAREERIILGAARLAGRPVREIMLSAEHVRMLHAIAPLADALVTAHLDMHTRYPVTERAGDPQGIIGYVNFKDLVAALHVNPDDPSVRGVTRSMPSVPPNLEIAGCLEQMIREYTHIALVREAAGRVLGMLTLEDILEELVGDIGDEYDRLPGHVTRSGAGWIVGGGTSLKRLREAAGIDLTLDLPAGGAQHLGEWLAGHLGRPPRGEDMVERQGVRVVVRKVRRGTLLEARLTRRGGEVTV